MANEFNEYEEPAPLPPDIRAAFKEYPRPKASDEFDTRFWNELDARESRYRGFTGFCRRLIEVEIEGIAVWRLGASTCGGALFCAIGFALLSWSASPAAKSAPSPAITMVLETPLAAPRLARGLLEIVSSAPELRRLPSPHSPKPTL